MSVRGSITTSDYLPFDEYQRLIKCLDDDGQFLWCTYCVLSFCLALRISDVLKLTWDEVLNKRSVTVKEKKTGKVKSIPIGSNTSEHLIELYNKLKRPNVHRYIFINNETNKVYTRQNINQNLKKWKDKYHIQIGNFSSHTFRKTFGRYVYNKMGRTEESLVILNQIFRHHSIQTTMIYIGLRSSEIGSVFNSIEI
jgi:integrase